MTIIQTKLKGAFIIERTPFKDDRGEFCRMFCRNELENAGIGAEFVQSNLSVNNCKGTLRGLHSQKAEFAEDKLVCAVTGSLLDVCVDVREGSPTYGEFLCVELTQNNHKSLYIPKGCAHGYVTLEDNSSILYFTTQFYTPDSEVGYRYDDPKFHINWGVDTKTLIISDKDLSWPYL